MKAIAMRGFRIKYVEEKEQADLVLSIRQDVTDFLALGVYCLHLLVSEDNCEEIKVYRNEDFSTQKSCGRVLTNTGSYELSENALKNVAIEYIPKIAQDILHVDSINAPILAVTMYLQITSYCMNIDRPLFLKKSLPEKFDFEDTLQAQETAWKLLLKYV